MFAIVIVLVIIAGVGIWALPWKQEEMEQLNEAFEVLRDCVRILYVRWWLGQR